MSPVLAAVSSSLQSKLKSSFQSVSATRRSTRYRRVEYGLTSDPHLQNLEANGHGSANDWRCFKCFIYYSDDKSKQVLMWTECDSCDNKMHVKCVGKSHSKKSQLNRKVKLSTYDFICENCCVKFCCSKEN